MLFGSKTPPSSEPQGESGMMAPQTQSGAIFDVTATDFEEKVMKASLETPVIVDFWAPWCGPCKQLMPILEKAVSAANGEVLLAKVNLDENPELAQALRVQSVPTVFAFFGGRPVDAFQGVQSEAKINEFITRLVQAARQNRPDAIDIPEALKAAAEALSQGDLQTASGIYMQVLEQDEQNAAAYAGLIRSFIAAGHIEQAAAWVEGASEVIAKDSAFAEAKTALEIAQNAPDADEINALEAAASKNPDDMQAQIDLAEAKFASGQKEDAAEILLAAIAKDREWNEQAARKALLKLFEAMGHSDPITVQARKKLSTLLFS